MPMPDAHIWNIGYIFQAIKRRREAESASRAAKTMLSMYIFSIHRKLDGKEITELNQTSTAEKECTIILCTGAGSVMAGGEGAKYWLHLTHYMPKSLDLLPVGKFDNRAGMGGSLGDPHDEPYHQAIEKTVFGIVDLAGENRELPGFPGDSLEEFEQIGIGVRLVFFWFARHHIHGKKGVGLAVQQLLVALDEIDHLGTVLAVTDAGADDDFVESRQIDTLPVIDGDQGNLEILLFYYRLQSPANDNGMAIGGGIDDQDFLLSDCLQGLSSRFLFRRKSRQATIPLYGRNRVGCL